MWDRSQFPVGRIHRSTGNDECRSIGYLVINTSALPRVDNNDILLVVGFNYNLKLVGCKAILNQRVNHEMENFENGYLKIGS